MPEFNRRPHSWSRRARLTAAALLCTTMLTGVGALTQVLPAQADQQSPAPLAAPAATAARPDGFANIVDAVKPAVVNIAVDKKGVAMVAADGNDTPDVPGLPNIPGLPKGFPFGNQDGGKGKGHRHQDGESGRAVGSGFIIDPAGYIVTNNHVIENSDSIKVTLADGSTHDAKLIGTDSKTDVALIKIDGKDLPYVQFGDSAKARVGDWVLAIGDPYGLGGTVTAGIVSARGRDIGAGPYDDFIQIDAAVNRGNSGGPAFNLNGEVVGINTAIFSPSGGNVGIAFAIPASTAKDVVNQLMDGGSIKRGWLGVQIQPVTDEIADSVGLKSVKGALVSEAQADGPAKAVGIAAGDIITAVNGKDVASPRELARLVAGIAPDSSVKVDVWRNGETKSFDVKLGTLPGAQDRADATTPDDDTKPGGSLADFGLTVTPSDDGKGLVVTDVDNDSAAAERQMQAGDVIVAVNSKPVASTDDVNKAVAEAEKAGRKAVLFQVKREETSRFVALPVGQG